MDSPPLNFGDYPFKEISNPHPHDVLSGRGGGTNNHIGNNHWRALVAANKQLYVTLPKRQKMLLSRSIVNAVRSQHPPGRFLQKDPETDLWYDIGDHKATEKTSQALREGAPNIRKVSTKEETETSTSTADSTKKSTSEKKQPEKVSVPKQETSSNNNTAIIPPFIPPPGSGQPTPTMQPPPPPISSPGMSPGMMYSPLGMGMFPGVMGFPQGGMSPGMMQFSGGVPRGMPPAALSQSGNIRVGRKHFVPENKQSSNAGGDKSSQKKPSSNPSMPPPAPQGAGFDFEALAQQVNPPLEPAGLSWGSMATMNTLEQNRLLQQTGCSIGSMSTGIPRVLPVDGGLEPAGLSAGSQFSQLSMNTTEQDYLAKHLMEPDPIREQSDGKPMYVTSTPSTTLEAKRSGGNLLESDTESEDEEDEPVAKKAEAWQKMQDAVGKAQPKHPKITIPPPIEDEAMAQTDLDRQDTTMSAMSFMSLDPITTNRNVSLAVAQLAGCNPTDLQPDVSIAFSEMSLSREVSLSDPIGAGGAAGVFDHVATKPQQDDLAPLPLSQSKAHDHVSEEEKLQMMYLARGGSLVFDNFGKTGSTS